MNSAKQIAELTKKIERLQARILELEGTTDVNAETRPIAVEADDRKRKTQTLQKTNIDLEQKILERTAELTNANALLRTEAEQHQRTRKALRDHALRLQALVGSIDEIVFEFDTDGTYLNVWTSNEQLLAWPKNRVIGRNVREFMDPRVAQPFLRAFEHTVQTGRHSSIEYPFQTLGGDRWFLARISAIPAADGKRPTVCMLARDITESRRIQAALSESEQRYRHLFEDSPIAIMELDASDLKKYFDEFQAAERSNLIEYLEHHPDIMGRVGSLLKLRVVNRAAVRLFQAQDKKALIERFPEVNSRETWPHFNRAVATLVAGALAWEEEIPVVTLRGERRVMLASASVIPGHEETMSRMIVSFSDLTALRRAEREVELHRIAVQHQRMESLAVSGRLAAGVAHEINNPLQAIFAQLRLLSEELPPEIGSGRRLQLVSTSLKQIAKIVNHLLDLHRRHDNTGERCRPAEVVANLKELVTSHLKSENVHLETNCSETTMTVPLSSSLLTQVLLNLILNAHDAMPSGGTIRVNVERDRTGVRMTVADEGKGIPPEMRSKVFSPFFTTKGPKGTGLGLSVTHSIVTGAGGTIEVRDRPGGGTIFEIRFPG